MRSRLWSVLPSIGLTLGSTVAFSADPVGGAAVGLAADPGVGWDRVLTVIGFLAILAGAAWALVHRFRPKLPVARGGQRAMQVIDHQRWGTLQTVVVDVDGVRVLIAHAPAGVSVTRLDKAP